MAKQIGIMPAQGTIDNLTFHQGKDGYIVKKKTSMTGSRMAGNPRFDRTRENNAEFGTATRAGRLLRHAVRSLILNAKDGKVASRLMKEMFRALKEDNINPRGERTVQDGQPGILKGFDFNLDGKFNSTLYAPYSTSIDRAAGTLTVSIPSFIPANMLVGPAGATHFRIVSAGTELDFANESFVTDTQSSPILPWDETATAALNLVNTVTAASTLLLTLCLGIQFFQEVNGTYHPLKTGVFNSLGIVKVDTV